MESFTVHSKVVKLPHAGVQAITHSCFEPGRGCCGRCLTCPLPHGPR